MLKEDFTLTELGEWFDKTKPSVIEMTEGQYEHYRSMLIDAEQHKDLFFRGIKICNISTTSSK